MLKFKKSAVAQYILIYIMLIVPGSCLFTCYLPDAIKYYALILLCLFLMLFKIKYRLNYSIIFVALLLIFVIFTRLISGGGVGITAWMQFAVCILSTNVAICCDRDHFLSRFIKTVNFFAVISIIFWAIFCIAPQLVDAWPAQSYFVQTLGTPGWEKDWYGKGLFLYSFLEIHPTRNCGIYTEPGKYQIILNSVLFILLFWKEKLLLTEREYKKSIFIIILTLFTCQSTTGYIGLVLILVFFFFYRNKNYKENKIKRYIVLLFSIGLIALLVDFAYRGEESIINLQIIEKLFGGNSLGLDVTEGTGQYRLGTILAGIDIIIKHPFGVGYDKFFAIRDTYGEGMVAASVVTFAAVYGIIPWLITMAYLFIPVFKNQKIFCAILILLLFINTTLAQTDLLYPALIMIPIYIKATNNKNIKASEKNTIKTLGKNQRECNLKELRNI